MTGIRTLLMDGGSHEYRAMGEGTTGGDLVKPGFADTVIRLLKEYDSVIADCEPLDTDTGSTWLRPQVSSLVASSSALSENTQRTSYGGEATGSQTQVTFAGQQSFGQTPVYVARLAASMQLIQDSDVDAEALLASAASESIGREVASVASTALYGAATSGQEVSLTTLTNAKIAGLVAKLDPAYFPGAKLYVGAADYAALLADDPVKLKAFPFPVVVTNAATAFSSGTVTGPVLANLGRFLTMRRAGGVKVQVLDERYAEWGQRAVNVYARVDFEPRGETTAAVFSK